MVGLCAPGAAQGIDAPGVETRWATVHDYKIAFYVAGSAPVPAVILEPGRAGHEALVAAPDVTAALAARAPPMGAPLWPGTQSA